MRVKGAKEIIGFVTKRLVTSLILDRCAVLSLPLDDLLPSTLSSCFSRSWQTANKRLWQTLELHISYARSHMQTCLPCTYQGEWNLRGRSPHVRFSTFNLKIKHLVPNPSDQKPTIEVSESVITLKSRDLKAIARHFWKIAVFAFLHRVWWEERYHHHVCVEYRQQPLILT